MNVNFIISENVLNTINSLNKEDRIAVASALTAELIMREKVTTGLTPMQEVIFSMIKSYIGRDTQRNMPSAQTSRTVCAC